jgi:hypothetical protein
MDIPSSTAFTMQAALPINPGLSASFPWLAQIAQQFEEWIPLGVVYEFKSTSADALNSTNTALGTIVMATEYNGLDPAFINKQQMENYENASSGKPAQTMLHGVECDPRQNPLATYFVRDSAVPSGQDQRFYDLGTFYIASVGSQAAATVGELWVSYEFCFRKPRLNPSVESLVGAGDHFTSTTAITNTNPFGTTQVNTNGVSPTGIVVGGVKTTFPPAVSDGQFYFSYSVLGNSTAVALPTIPTTNCTLATYWSGDTVNNIGTGGTTTRMNIDFIINVTAPNASFTFSGITIPTSATTMDYFCIPMPSSIST